MFESDDYDQVLSQFDFPEISTNKQENSEHLNTSNVVMIESESYKTNPLQILEDKSKNIISTKCSNNEMKKDKPLSPKHTKRKIINTFFDHKNKRKFPGPAGLLSGCLEETRDESIGQIELLSQDIDFSHNHLQRGLFELPLWSRLLCDIKKWNLGDINSINTIKQQALAGNLLQKKAQVVAAFVETVDRSATDPLITLRDATGTIKCTLHRDAWSSFSSYILPEHCALVLYKPTVLTTGGAFKKHYLNITLSNVYAIYSSLILNDEAENKPLPNDYTKICIDDFTIIKSEICQQDIGADFSSISNVVTDTNGLLEGLDTIFSDESF